MDYINLIKRNTEFTINKRVYIYIKDKLAIIDYRTNNTPLLFRSDRKLLLRLPIMIHLYRDCYDRTRYFHSNRNLSEKDR